MLVKLDGKASWLGLETARECVLLGVALGAAFDVSNDLINSRIQAMAGEIGYSEEDLIFEGINAEEVKVFVQDLAQRVSRIS